MWGMTLRSIQAPCACPVKWPPFSNRGKSEEPGGSPGSLVLLFSSSSPLLSFPLSASTFPPPWPLYPLSWFFTVWSPVLNAKLWATDILQGRQETGKGQSFLSRCSPSSWRDRRRVRRELETKSGLQVAQMVKICLQCRRPRFDPWVRKIPWRRD